MKKAEVYILSGFLGTGKTTLLKQILQNEKNSGRNIAVMMNELGSVSIDSDAVDTDVPLKELLGGCICCTIQDKLESQLQGLLFDHDLDAIYIETTGAAHPVEVLDAVLSPLFADKLAIKGIITTVDGKQWLNRQSLDPQVHQLLLEQVKHADLNIVNKSDLLNESEQAKISMDIQGLNPQAKCILSTYSKVPLKLLEGLAYTEKAKSAGAHVQADLRLSTFVHQFQSAISQKDFEDFLRSLPDSIYRIKGYVLFDHSQYPDLFQYSYGMPLYMKEYMKMPLNLVFIGQVTDWSQLEQQLKELEK
ncbi:CobW family GTP-binding protein [Mesobacillus selenatarsenatis]|uniref:Putative metal chaperone, involved in Zn homeostasis, GTPase of COG0523 family n=1 Tax=Mesobacillus selenatarsenatis (strain DSM 18680 / JCM 14380 / FERM P-15431 / SF-1) TaxID=1321606 RepID=A0A0A8XF41_MESS1|nr:CobW family GTP-binding protein [Mesobacillus selenatarsenatis]GAM16756.1 putative metal chaperone, involved in Zn homeostasis, GTPase of COG0523 family [Mesobacillus selenatarsenatis SF-1]